MYEFYWADGGAESSFVPLCGYWDRICIVRLGSLYLLNHRAILGSRISFLKCNSYIYTTLLLKTMKLSYCPRDRATNWETT